MHGLARLALVAALAIFAVMAAGPAGGASSPPAGPILYRGLLICPFDPRVSSCEGMPAYRSAIFVIPRVGAAARLLTTRRYNDSSPAWSSDRRRIAFVRSLSPETGDQIWVMNADGRNARQLTRGRVDGSPDWSPDGRWIAYRSGRDIYVLRPDGSGRRNVTRNPAGVGAGNPSWSADGRRITFQRSATPIGTGIYSIGVDGKGLKRLARDGYDPDWSPDGRTIVYMHRAPFSDAGWQLHTMRPNGGAKRRLTRGGGHESPHFSPDGTWIAVVRNGQVTVLRADGTGSKQLTKRRAGFTIDGLAW